MPAPASAGPAANTPWDALRARALAATDGLPAAPGPGPAGCVSCRGPLRQGYARCFQCDLHAQSAPGLLADVVAPVAYAPKGSALARDLWLYKSGRPGAREAGTALRALLLVFLHDHGGWVWRQAGMATPTHVCVVPSCRGRPGPHPLQELLRGCLALPLDRAALRARRRPVGARPGPRPVPRAVPAPRCGGPIAGRHVDLGRERPVRRDGAQARGGQGRGNGRAWPPRGSRWRAAPDRPATRPAVNRLRA